jgi:nicotinamidase-related amidase
MCLTGGASKAWGCSSIPLPAACWHNLNMVPARSTTALLVIDVQESVLEGSSDVEGVLERINELARVARSNDSPVVYVQHQDPHDAEMAAGSPGWQLASALERLADDPWSQRATETVLSKPSFMRC